MTISFFRVLFAAASLSALAAAPALAQTEVVMHAKQATAVVGDWQRVANGSAAGGVRMWNPNRGAAKLNTALAAPYDYFELTFTADAVVPTACGSGARPKTTVGPMTPSTCSSAEASRRPAPWRTASARLRPPS